MEQIYVALVIGISFFNMCWIVLHVDELATTSDAILTSVAWSVTHSVLYFGAFTIAMEMAKTTIIGDDEEVKKLEKKRFWLVLSLSVAYVCNSLATYTVHPGWFLEFGFLINNILLMLAICCALLIVEKQYRVIAGMLRLSGSNKNATSAKKETVSDDPKIQALQKLRNRIRSFRACVFVVFLLVIYNIATFGSIRFKYIRLAQPCKSELFPLPVLVSNLATIIFVVGFPLKRQLKTKVGPDLEGGEKKKSSVGWSSDKNDNKPS